MKGADLRDCILKSADLRGANLEGARLNGADMRDARLGPLRTGERSYVTNLREALLRRSDLRGADLQGARLVAADLTDAALFRARLDGCDLTGARSEEHTSELQSLMRISYAVFCLKKKTQHTTIIQLTSISIT